MLDIAISYHVIGVGGSGMMPLALLMASRGYRISGSDRSFDTAAVSDPRRDPRRLALESAGVAITSQSNGGGGAGKVVIVSTAIESDNPDLFGARAVLHRSEILAALVAERAEAGVPIVLIGGSSGKTTTTAMTGWILKERGLDPFIYVGGQVSDLAPWGARAGDGPVIVEVDESDGSIDRFTPGIAVVTSVSEDHKPLAEIEALFTRFLAKCTRAVVASNADPLCRAAGLHDEQVIVVSPGAASSPLPGAFNRVNEALAVEAARAVGVEAVAAVDALATFPGVARRLEMVWSDERRAVLDDFAHNPEKVEASLEAVKALGRPVIAIFQPHGYGPLRMHREALARIFSSSLGPGDRLILLPVYDAGGSADRSIRSDDLASLVTGGRAEVVPDRAAAIIRACELASETATIVVMGARDATLPGFARGIGSALSSHQGRSI